MRSDNVNLMNRTIAIIAVSLWAASLSPAQESPVFNATNLAPGTIVRVVTNLVPGTVVRIVAKRPAINLGRAEVLQCTSNMITVRRSGGSVSAETFHVASTNVLELDIVESGKVSSSPEDRDVTASADPPAKRPAKTAGPAAEPVRQSSPFKNLLERLRGFWK